MTISTWHVQDKEIECLKEECRSLKEDLNRREVELRASAAKAAEMDKVESMGGRAEGQVKQEGRRRKEDGGKGKGGAAARNRRPGGWGAE